MILPLPLLAVVLGIVEGVTEFLPISSTGHLILVSRFFGFVGDRAEVFEIFIQLGAVLAVVVEYRAKLFGIARDLPRTEGARRFVIKIAIAFVPAAVLGFLAHHWISEHLFGTGTVGAAMIVGAFAIMAVEMRPRAATIGSIDEIGTAQAALIGLAQCVSLWSGFSRSAATILGGLLCGLDRKVATEFSFFLAIPTLGAATVYELIKKRDLLAPGDMTWLLVATVVSFVVAWASIRWLLRFVASHSLLPFAWYRLCVGILVVMVRLVQGP